MAKTKYWKHRTVDFRLTVLFSCNETERTDNMNNKDFMQEVKEKREEYGISQSRFAVACGISREYYNRIENGKTPLTEELKQEITKQLERFNPDEPLFLLIDYFRVRFPTTDALTVIKNVLHIKAKHMLHEDYGKYGYEEQYFTGNIVLLLSSNPVLGVLLELKGKGCRQMEAYLTAEGRSWFDFMLDCLSAGGVMKRLDLAINDRAGILNIPMLKEKWKRGEAISYFRGHKGYDSTKKNGGIIPEDTGNTLYVGSTSSEVYFCIYEKAKEQYAKLGMDIEDIEVKNRFEIRLKNERAYRAVADLLTYYDAERTAFSIINRYLCFVDAEEDKPKSEWKVNEDWAWFIGEYREALRLTTQPEPFTLERALRWLHRQVAPTLKMVQELDRQNHTTILKDMLEHTELKEKHKHLLELEKTDIKDRIDTAVQEKTDGVF